MRKTYSGFWMLILYNFVPIVSNGTVLVLINFVIGALLYEQHGLEIFRRVILDNPLKNFLINILPFPLLILILFIIHYPAFRVFSRNKSDPRYITGLRRVLNAPFNIGLWSFLGWIFGNIMARAVYFMSDITQPPIMVVRIAGISVVSGILNFVLCYYSLSLINRRLFIPKLFPDGNLHDVTGVKRLSLRFNLEIFVLAVATAPILILGLSLLNIQGMVPEDKRPAFGLSIGLILGLIGLGVFVSTLLARSLRRPLSRMRNAAQTIQNGDYSVKLLVDTTDELGDLALSINEMARGLTEKEKIKDSFGRAVDPRVRDYLLSHGGEMGGEQVEATILFSDIRGFTSFSESHSAHEVVEWLNNYFERMALCVRNHGGIVNKYVGDAILAVFNSPLPLKNHEQAAVDCAFEMLEKLAALNHELREKNIPEMRIGIGVHTGPVVAGNIGSRDRQEFTVIGDTVNTASRIEGLCKKFQVPLLVSENIFKAAGANTALRKLGFARVKGKADTLTIYGLPNRNEKA